MNPTSRRRTRLARRQKLCPPKSEEKEKSRDRKGEKWEVREGSRGKSRIRGQPEKRERRWRSEAKGEGEVRIADSRLLKGPLLSFSVSPARSDRTSDAPVLTPLEIIYTNILDHFLVFRKFLQNICGEVAAFERDRWLAGETGKKLKKRHLIVEID
jgi:hypothetical protein